MPAIWQISSSHREQRTKAIEPVPGGMRQKRAAERLGVSVSVAHDWTKTYREGSMAALHVLDKKPA